jgi:NAD(P)-dependent dehydrogenase (short-subunit alcohol dehydrogenase family)
VSGFDLSGREALVTGDQCGVGGRDDPVPGHLGVLGNEVGGRPADPRRNVVALTPAGLGEIGDMTDVVVFLCSDAARFITGTGLAIDGGMGS